MSLPAGASDAVRVAGGDINEAWRVKLADGRLAFVKTRAGADPQEFASEAAGLGWLAQAGALRVPEVWAVAPDHLVLEWIKPGILSTAGEEELGRGLARLHGAGAVAFGGQTPFRIGALTLSNDPCSSWAEFYVQRRLLPLAARIGETALLERVAARVEELCAPQAAPARLHGDLWRGNVLADQDGLPWLIDPAPYGGHHEVDLAMYELFGGRSKRVLAAYEEVSPLRDGYAERVALWQLFPLLVHAVLFGGSYVAAVREAAHRYV